MKNLLLFLSLALILATNANLFAEDDPCVDETWTCPENSTSVYIDCTPGSPNPDCRIWFYFCYKLTLDEFQEPILREISVQSWGIGPDLDDCDCVDPEEEILLTIWQMTIDDLGARNVTQPVGYTVIEEMCWEETDDPPVMTPCEDSSCCNIEYKVVYRFIDPPTGPLIQLVDTVVYTGSEIPVDDCLEPCQPLCQEWIFTTSPYVVPKISINNREYKRINDIELGSIIYPNPSDGEVIIQLNKIPDASVKVIVTTSEGKVVKINNRINSIDDKINLDLTGVAQGIYFYRVLSESGVLSAGKIIIE